MFNGWYGSGGPWLHGGGWFPGMLIMMLVWLLIVALIIYVLIRVFSRPSVSGMHVADRRLGSAHGADDALQIVRERYAHGEITRDEYQRIVDDLAKKA